MTVGKAADPLLSIGMFSRRSRSSMKALRLYDRRGLLTPADVDPDTGYRRYRESQLANARLMRCESAHREAYVRLRKAQVEFPQILSAYDGVTAWIVSHGRTATGAPREIYFADFRAASPADEVCDVAFPIE